MVILPALIADNLIIRHYGHKASSNIMANSTGNLIPMLAIAYMTN